VGWYSTNPKITETVINQLLTMPDPITKHSQAFDQYAEDLSQAWSTVTKKLISNLPLEDRKNIEWGDLEIYEKGQTTRTETLAGRGGTLHHSDGFSRHQEDRSLIIKTVRNGVETYYEFDPQRKELRKRDDWKNSFHEGPQGPETEIQYGGLGKNLPLIPFKNIRPLMMPPMCGASQITKISYRIHFPVTEVIFWVCCSPKTL